MTDLIAAPGSLLEAGRALSRPTFDIGIWWVEDDDDSPADAIIAHSTADGLATWLRRWAAGDPTHRDRIRRLQSSAVELDRRWTTYGDVTYSELTRPRTIGSPPWLRAAVVAVLPDRAAHQPR